MDMSTVITKWVTVSDAAATIGCSARHVRRLAAQGQLRQVKVNPRLTLVHAVDVQAVARDTCPTGRPRGR